jgi:hypothetical protein
MNIERKLIEIRTVLRLKPEFTAETVADILDLIEAVYRRIEAYAAANPRYGHMP